jgi:hypothetical protein
VPNLVAIDSDTRIFLLKQSLNTKDFEKLGFQKDFLSFMQNYEFITKFFDEVISENVTLEDIETQDFKGEFIEHIEILKEVYNRYAHTLEQNGFYDKSTLKEYKINESFLKQFEHITIYLEGYLTNRELEIINQVSSIVQTNIIIHSTKFNQKMVNKFFDNKDEIYGTINFDITNNKIENTKLKEEDKKFNQIEISNFSNELYQISFALKKITDYIEKDNFDPERIAIIVPNESFATKLKTFDKFDNLNFAMGFGFVQTLFYKKLDTIYQLLKHHNLQLQEKYAKYELEKVFDTIKNSKKNSYELFIEIYYSIINTDISNNEKEIIDETIFKISKYKDFLKEYTLVEIIYFAMSLLSKHSLDDANSGKIKVMGVLESRSIGFDAVIIIDFNENIVPKPSVKDIFLNSTIKKLSNLPTLKDRENLQKYYYYRLIRNSKKVAISYVENDTLVPSRFLKELNIKTITNQDSLYSKILFKEQKDYSHFDQEFEIEFDYRTKTLSASQLKTFLECKYKYFLKYIKDIKNHQLDENQNIYIGKEFHNAFYNILDPNIYDTNIIQKNMQEFIKNRGINIVSQFDLDLFAKQIEPFLNKEVQRYKDGFVIVNKEHQINFKYQNISFTTRIDRIDKKNDKYFVIDYKTSKTVKVEPIKNSEHVYDFQLPIYTLAIKSQNIPFGGAFLYDVRSAKLIEDIYIDSKLKLLDEKLESFKQTKLHIYKCEDERICTYCEYKTICDR